MGLGEWKGQRSWEKRGQGARDGVTLRKERDGRGTINTQREHLFSVEIITLKYLKFIVLQSAK